MNSRAGVEVELLGQNQELHSQDRRGKRGTKKLGSTLPIQ